MKKTFSLIYIIGTMLYALLFPAFLILVIFKLCDATSLAWIYVFVPLIVIIATLPFMAAAKFFIDAGGKK